MDYLVREYEQQLFTLPCLRISPRNLEDLAIYISEGYPRTPDSSEGLIPRAIICYMGIDPYVLFF